MFVWKDENIWKRGGRWHIFLKKNLKKLWKFLDGCKLENIHFPLSSSSSCEENWYGIIDVRILILEGPWYNIFFNGKQIGRKNRNDGSNGKAA